MPARAKAAPKDSSANLGFETTALRDSAPFKANATLRSLKA